MPISLFPERFARLLTGIPAFAAMKCWQAKQAEKVSSQLVPPPAPASPSGVGAVTAMRGGS